MRLKEKEVAKKNLNDQVKEMEMMTKKKFGIWCK